MLSDATSYVMIARLRDSLHLSQFWALNQGFDPGGMIFKSSFKLARRPAPRQKQIYVSFCADCFSCLAVQII